MSATSSPTAGAWDFYCHTAPCLIPRWGDATDVAREAERLGFEGLVLQSHHENTHGRAQAAQSAVAGVRVLGGPTLNRHVGGLSARSVRAALLAGARIVWLPTLDARTHVESFGAGMSLGGPYDPDDRDPGLDALDGAGGQPSELEQIVRLLGRHGAILCSGHAGAREIHALVELTGSYGVTFVINHPYFVFRPDHGWWNRLPEHVFVQIAAVAHADDPRLPALDDVLEVIRRVGADRCVLGSEAKAPTHPLHQLLDFCDVLRSRGVSAGEVQVMIGDTPRALVAGLTTGGGPSDDR